MKKVLLIILGTLVVIIAGVFLFVLATWHKTFESPIPQLSARTDSAYILRGQHLAYGPAHCVDCHVSPGNMKTDGRGAMVPLIGGMEFDIPPGIFRTPNLTPDPETGIGRLTDGEIARALRYSVKHDGSYMIPFMAFQNMSDDDIVAILSFLRSQKPVHHEVKPDTYRFLGKALMAFGALKPAGPLKTPPEKAPIGSSAAYGAYLANNVANCVGCHTNRDMKSGKPIGPFFAGGLKFLPDPLSEGYSFISPNLTPDKNTGIMAAWDERTFINRIHGGRVYKGSPMPWEAFNRMDDTELKAIYEYLHSLSPVDNKIGKVMFQPGEKMKD